MLVNDAFGRRVSLLNDGGSAGGPLPKTSPSHPSSSPQPRCVSRGNSYAYSRKSSYSSQMSHCSESSSYTSEKSNYDSPVYSPGLRPTPQLLRLDSSSSQQSLQTPSPMTPTYPFDPLDQQNKSMNANTNNNPYYGQDEQQYFVPQPGQQTTQGFFSVTSPETLLLDPGYSMQTPLQPAPLPYQYPTDLIPPSSLPSVTPVQTSVQSAPSNPASVNNQSSKGAKKKYPCPHARAYNCNDTFTTSGHAARHGKKHTGEKNILCPTCNKAFTRKDNMKQHERTHRQNRDSTSTAPTDSTKRTKNNLGGGPSASTDQAIEMDLDVTDVDPQATIRPTRPNLKRPPLQIPDAHPTSFDSMDRVLNSLTGDFTEEDNATTSPQYNDPDYRKKFAATQPPPLHLDSLDKGFGSPSESSYKKRNVEGEVVNPTERFKPGLDRTFSAGSGFGSQDGEGESPGLDALAMAASEMS